MSPEKLQQQVFDGDFWGGIWTSEGATSRFEAALSSEAAANSYDPTQAILYTGNEVRYNTVSSNILDLLNIVKYADYRMYYPMAWSAFVLAPLTRIVQSTIFVFSQRTVAPLLTTGASYSSQSAAVLATPIASTFVNLVPFEFGSRIVFNTIGFVFPSLFQFFVSSSCLFEIATQLILSLSLASVHSRRERSFYDDWSVPRDVTEPSLQIEDSSRSRLDSRQRSLPRWLVPDVQRVLLHLCQELFCTLVSRMVRLNLPRLQLLSVCKI